jgi:hypothetical protein
MTAGLPELLTGENQAANSEEQASGCAKNWPLILLALIEPEGPYVGIRPAVFTDGPVALIRQRTPGGVLDAHRRAVEYWGDVAGWNVLSAFQLELSGDGVATLLNPQLVGSIERPAAAAPIMASCRSNSRPTG